MRATLALAVLVLLPACDRAPAPSTMTNAASPALFGIGGGEADTHTHVSFVAPPALVRASARVVVDRTQPTGLNFFAMQVNFKNTNTWAHGGLQDVNGANGTRRRQANWGGLVNRGGGSGDYAKEDDAADIEKMQNPTAPEHLAPYEWRNGVEYEYVIERGAKVTLPPGEYHFMPGKPAVRVDHPREMWEWRFSVRATNGEGAPFVAMLYDAADSFSSFSVWNESGGGGGGAHEQHTSWRAPMFRTLAAPTADVAPSSWKHFRSTVDNADLPHCNVCR